MTTKESFFSLLKSHRESKGVEIQEIAEYTKINPKYLIAIESGNFKVLPNVYMRLFLRSYAQYIGADAQQALNDYELHTTGTVNVKLKNISEHSLDNTKKGSGDIPTVLGNSPIPPKQIMTGLAVVLGIFFFFNLVSSLSEPQFEAEPTEKADVEAQIYPENNRKVEAISLSPNDVEKKLPTSSETTETLQENVKKKP
jgi:cytoskeletal protein RodZ|tara:strand:- start:1485 stop:2078 length:594 start_codon:yes stop_codon:yes gene_type:complete